MTGGEQRVQHDIPQATSKRRKRWQEGSKKKRKQLDGGYTHGNIYRLIALNGTLLICIAIKLVMGAASKEMFTI